MKTISVLCSLMAIIALTNGCATHSFENRDVNQTGPGFQRTDVSKMSRTQVLFVEKDDVTMNVTNRVGPVTTVDKSTSGGWNANPLEAACAGIGKALGGLIRVNVRVYNNRTPAYASDGGYYGPDGSWYPQQVTYVTSTRRENRFIRRTEHMYGM